MLEYRVAVIRAGINSYDYYTHEDKALERFNKLCKSEHRVVLQTREVSEWEDVSSR